MATMTAWWGVIAYHGTEGGETMVPLFLFGGAVATVAWLLLSRLQWRTTVLLTGAGWVLGGTVTFIL